MTIVNNRFNNIKANEKSVSAVGVLQSTSTNQSTGLLIDGNIFSNIASQTKGAYGVIINNKAGTPGAQITNNSFFNLTGSWTHAIGLEVLTIPDAVVLNNQFSNVSASGLEKVAVFFEDNPAGGSVSVAFNQFNGTDFAGVAIHPDDLSSYSYTANATDNWWGDASGSSGAGTGTGAAVSTNVTFDPWLGAQTEEVVSGNGSVALPGDEVTVQNTGTGSPTVILAKVHGQSEQCGYFRQQRKLLRYQCQRYGLTVMATLLRLPCRAAAVSATITGLPGKLL